MAAWNHWTNTVSENELMRLYGLYANGKVEMGEMPATYDDWLEMERTTEGGGPSDPPFDPAVNLKEPAL